MSDIRNMLSNRFQVEFLSDNDLLEIQSLSVEEVVAFKAKQAFNKFHIPIAVSDSGLEIEALKKFPGALVKFTNETIGQEGIVKLLEGKNNRRAFFVAAIGYCDKNGEKVFVDRDEGTIAYEPKGTGWYFDRIFIPKGEIKTWAEIGREKKNLNSAFKRAIEKLANYLMEK